MKNNVQYLNFLIKFLSNQKITFSIIKLLFMSDNTSKRYQILFKIGIIKGIYVS